MEWANKAASSILDVQVVYHKPSSDS
jgi:hypothetical protein